MVQGLVDGGKKVCLIGKDEETRGVWDLSDINGVIDTRNLLSLGSLIALIAKARTLVSNDSSPVHLAGAFDNWIVLFPTCKHPDYIIPYRHGRLDYKTLALYKKLTIDDIHYEPTCVEEVSGAEIVNDWDTYLVSSTEAVDKILKI